MGHATGITTSSVGGEGSSPGKALSVSADCLPHSQLRAQDVALPHLLSVYFSKKRVANRRLELAFVDELIPQ